MVYYLQTLHAKQLIGLLTRGETPKRAIKSPYKPKKIKAMKTTFTIYDIKRLTAETSPYFFDRKTLKFFGQRMNSFKIYKQADGRYLVTAPIIIDGKQTGKTERYFDPITNKLEHK